MKHLELVTFLRKRSIGTHHEAQSEDAYTYAVGRLCVPKQRIQTPALGDAPELEESARSIRSTLVH